ncbi:MAG: hypothetical protein RJA22_508 [Verrucomicrobiota bacterium]|jgi:ribosomal protein L7/L12
MVPETAPPTVRVLDGAGVVDRLTPMNTPISGEQRFAIHQALHGGQKIEAIKLYRDATGARLSEAKEAVEKMEAELRAATPEKFTRPEARKGCVGLLLSLVVVIGFLCWGITR